MYSAQLELVHEKLSGNGSEYVPCPPSALGARLTPFSLLPSVITKAHVQTSFENAKPSTSDAARLQFERMYAGFSKARNTDFSVAEVDASATSDALKSHVHQQRTALA
jgi:hypothetical protein